MILAKNGVDFKDLEKEIFKQCCLSGCELIKTTLEAYDTELAEVRDKSKYRNKGKRKTVIKTIMGEVEYKRNVYEVCDGDGTKSFVYLLDEAIGIKGSGFMSGLMSELIAQAVCEAPYRSAAHSVSEMTGQSISHTAAWKVVQDLGAGVDRGEQLAAKAAAESRGTGELLTPVLFEEQDGIWLNLQGKSRKQYGKSKEMKLAIAYDGTRKTGKKRYELTNKIACANFESGEKFQKRKEGIVARSYNVDEIEMRFLNGDGAPWIKQAITDERVHFQLDTFHRNKAIRTYVNNPEMQKEITKLLYNNRIDELLVYIEALSNSVEDINERDNLLALHTYFTNNKAGLVPCHKRGLNIPNPPEGKEYRHMGAMESNIFTIAGNRMKGRRACWSIEGGNNLVRLLCLKCTNKLSETLQNLTSLVLPEKYSEEIFTGFSAGKVSKSSGKGYDGFRKAAQSPATLKYKWLREIGSQRSLV
jgi:hypothetical protein